MIRKIKDLYVRVKTNGCRSLVAQRLIILLFVIIIIRSMSYSYIPFPESLSKLISYDQVLVSEQAKLLPKKGRLLCFVITTPKHYNSRVPAVYETWLPRCDHGQFFTTVPMSEDIPHSTVFSGVPDNYRYLFQKTLLALHYAYTNISDQFDWYYKADDDTYVIMEHMYEYLATLDPNEPYYLGYNMRPYLKRGYNGGGAGYVLSRAAMKLFVDRVFLDSVHCPFDPNEDVGIGRCLEYIEIFPHDTRNERGQHRFHTYRPDDMFAGYVADEWHFFPQIKGHDWIAPELISIHHLSPLEIRTYDDLLYRMRSPQLSPHSKSILVDAHKKRAEKFRKTRKNRGHHLFEKKSQLQSNHIDK